MRGTNVLNPKGMEVEMGQLIAAKLGLKTVKFYNVSNFSNIYSSAPKPYDFALAEVTITPARAKAVAFSVPYYNANQGVLIRKGLSPVPTSIADLRNLVLCAQTGTTGADFIKSKIRPTKTALFPSTTTDHVPAGAERPLRRLRLRRADPRRPEGHQAERLRPDRRPDQDRASSTASSSRRAASCCPR